jgi:hypothetical protein
MRVDIQAHMVELNGQEMVLDLIAAELRPGPQPESIVPQVPVTEIALAPFWPAPHRISA